MRRDTLGYFSKRQARFIVMEEIYDDMVNVLARQHPAIYAHMMEIAALQVGLRQSQLESLRTDRLAGQLNKSTAMNMAVPIGKRWYGFLVAVVLLSMAVTSFAAWHRLPWTDEGNFSCAAFNIANRGFFGTTVLDPAGNNLPRIDQRTYWIVPGYPLFEAAFYKIAPGF